MTKNILNAALLLVGAGSLLTGCNFEQPEAPCFVQDSTAWAVKYDPVDEPTLVTGGGACTSTVPSAELVGVYKFVNPDDPSKTVLTMRPAGVASLGVRDTTNPSSAHTAVGQFSLESDAQDFCAATGFTEAKASAPATATAAAAEVSYQYESVEVYAAPSTPGTQLKGLVTITRNGCRAQFAMRGLWPATPCDPDSDVPEENCGEGSGLNPDFAVVCDAVSHFCVPAKAIPSLVDAEG